jgi:hypothetical protein
VFFVFTSQFKTYEELGRDADKYNDLTARYHDSWFHNERYLTDLMGPPAPDRTELHKDFRFANFHVHRTCTLCGMSDRYHNHNICRAGQRVVFQRACRGCNKRENPRNREKRRAIYAAFHRDGPRTGASSAQARAEARASRAESRASSAKARASSAKAAKARAKASARAARREASRGQSFVVPSDSDEDEDEDQEDDLEDEDEDQDEDLEDEDEDEDQDEDQDEDEDDDGYPTEFEDDEKDVIANAASAKARASASASAKAKARAQQEKQKKKKRRNRRYEEDQEDHEEQDQEDHEEQEHEDQEDDGEYCTCQVFRCYDVDLREHAEAIQTPYEDGIIRYQWGHVPDYKELYYWFWVLLGR